MSVVDPSVGISGVLIPGLNHRQAWAAMLGMDVETFAGGVGAVGPGHGLVRPGHLAVTQADTPAMKVKVAAGMCWITGDSVLAQGPYPFTNTAAVELDIATADSTNDRHDLVCAQVQDDIHDSSTESRARLMVVTGTPDPSPSDPAVPAGCLVLARVVVAASASSITNSDITMLASRAGVEAISGPFTAATGWTLSGTQLGWRLGGGLVQIRCTVERTGGTITVDTAGNFANSQIATAAAELRGNHSAGLPVSSAASGRAATGSYVPASGVLSLAAVGGTADILNGDLIELGGVVLVDI